MSYQHQHKHPHKGTYHLDCKLHVDRMFLSLGAKVLTIKRAGPESGTGIRDSNGSTGFFGDLSIIHGTSMKMV